MTKGRITLLSTIITLLLSPINAQTGEGCYGRLRPCPPGQVRINAQLDSAGAFVGGCTCGCPPSLADPSSPNYCGAPRAVDFNPATNVGNCQCTCPPDAGAATCLGRQLYHQAKCACECPSWMPAQGEADCTAPLMFLPELCECGCPQGSVFGPCTATINGVVSFIPGSQVTEECTCDTTGVICAEPAHSPDPTTGLCSCPEPGAAAPGGGFYPLCELPQIQDPVTCDCVTTTTTAPPFGAPQVANCESVGDCGGCHPGTTGTCTINCDVGNDACKDGTITCGNTGADCIVNCVAGSACAGAAKIIGPTGGGSLIVNCHGEKSCEGSVSMDASASTKQLIVDCQGSQACKGSATLNFGTLGGKLTCAGAPDSCQGMGPGSFVLPAGIESTPMASFECVGQFCPAGAPANFNNVPQHLRPVVPVPIVPSGPVPPPTLFAPIVNMVPVPVPGPVSPANPQPPAPQYPAPPVNQIPVVPQPVTPPPVPTPAPILILPPGITPPLIPGLPPIPFIHSGDIPPGGLPPPIQVTPINPPPVAPQPGTGIPPPQPPLTPIIPSPPNQIPPPVPPQVSNPNPPPLIPPPVPPQPQQPGTGIPPPQPPQPGVPQVPHIPQIPQIPQTPIWQPPIYMPPAIPQPAPGTGGSTGGTLIMNTGNQPIPIVRPDEEVICEGQGGECSCTGTRSCTLKCETQDACKEKILSCPMAHDCTVLCTGHASCVSATINAPHGKDLTVNCAGQAACVDSTFSARETANTAYTCSAKDSCKGSTSINCGSGRCEVACQGEASCDSATIAVNTATSFLCSGAAHCPAQFTAPPVPIPSTPPTSPCAGYSCTCGNALQCFSNPEPTEGCNCVCPDNIMQQAMLSDPSLICGVSNGAQEFNIRTCGCDCPLTVNRNCPPTQVFNQNKCQCECPGGNECPGASIMNPETCNCECPSPRLSPADCGALGRVLRNCQCACQQECAGPGQIQDLRTCQCACPANTPLPSQCPSGVVDELMCECAPEVRPPQSPYCCHPRIEAMAMWNGRCFGRASETDCNAEPMNRCTWKGPTVGGVENPNSDCLDNPPRWPRGNGPICAFRLTECISDEQCCSGICLMDNTCL